MARKNRFAAGGTVFHVINRGNDKRVIFREPADYERFLKLLRAGARQHPIELYGYCPMPTHFHLVVRPETDDALSSYMQWVTCCYACDLRARTATVGHGHVFQRRFWNAAVHDDLHFLTLLRYVEANPFRAELVPDAQNWPWSSFCHRTRNDFGILSPLPVDLPSAWAAIVNSPQRSEILERIRKEIAPKRGRPKAP